jgi:hypothetical protein
LLRRQKLPEVARRNPERIDDAPASSFAAAGSDQLSEQVQLGTAKDEASGTVPVAE